MRRRPPIPQPSPCGRFYFAGVTRSLVSVRRVVGHRPGKQEHFGTRGRSNHRRSTHSRMTIAPRATVAGVALFHKTLDQSILHLQAFLPVHHCLGERSRNGEVRAGPGAKFVDCPDQFEQ